ncbi:LysE family translocator [Caulobacter sp.]|uniref:LysE family translocator n=1 Tax=Caulobacter sp. TaxID=78 RepID=UPI003BACF7A8
MFSLSTLATFGAGLLVLQLTPGPDMMLVVGRGIGQGRRIALLTVLGMTVVAGVVQVSLLVLGVASLLATTPLALTALRWVGAAYLVWLGGKLIIGSFRGHAGARTVAPVSAWRAVREGMVNNLTNPKPLLFMFAFLPQFVDPARGPVWLQLLILGCLQKLSGMISLGSAALASGAVGGWLARAPERRAWQERFTGLVMISLGLRLLLSGDLRAVAR